MPDNDFGEGRTIVVTGAASGIGAATAKHLRAQGDHVIGVDLAGVDVNVDLATLTGRAALVDAIRDLAPHGIDGIVANAGVHRRDAMTVRVNYFGAIASLEGLRPLLRLDAPRAVLITSRAVLLPVDDGVVEACLAGNEGAPSVWSTRYPATPSTRHMPAANEQRADGYDAQLRLRNGQAQASRSMQWRLDGSTRR